MIYIYIYIYITFCTVDSLLFKQSVSYFLQFSLPLSHSVSYLHCLHVWAAALAKLNGIFIIIYTLIHTQMCVCIYIYMFEQQTVNSAKSKQIVTYIYMPPKKGIWQVSERSTCMSSWLKRAQNSLQQSFRQQSLYLLIYVKNASRQDQMPKYYYSSTYLLVM